MKIGRRPLVSVAGTLGLALILGLMFFSCWMGNQMNTPIGDSYFMVGTKENQGILGDLFSLLENETPGEEGHFAVVREIAHNYVMQQEYSRLINFLTSLVNENPHDPYNTYYLFMTAIAHMQEEAYPVAALYFNLIIKNYPDLKVLDESIHLACLNHLISIVDNADQRVWYYEELIQRFPDSIDLGITYFLMAQAYEQIGEWNKAVQAYIQFLPYVGTNVPGFPNADTYARQLVDFHNSPKNWTYESLDSLLIAIKNALDSGSHVRLEQCRAKVNFFARTWEQQDTDDRGMVDFHLADFMRANRINYAAQLDTDSNANEAYLRTWGWSLHMSTWYLYFRKINFPIDPEIHGRWEWAGIYYGEKL